eukprot:Rmarinus@m.28728
MIHQVYWMLIATVLHLPVYPASIEVREIQPVLDFPPQSSRQAYASVSRNDSMRLFVFGGESPSAEEGACLYQISTGIVEQYGIYATASHELSSEWGQGSAMDATSLPDGAMTITRCWTPGQAVDAWLEVEFETPVHAEFITVFEQGSLGFVSKVAVGLGDECCDTVWEGEDDADSILDGAWDPIGNLVIDLGAPSEQLVDTVRIYTHAVEEDPGAQVDAILLTGTVDSPHRTSKPISMVTPSTSRAAMAASRRGDFVYIWGGLTGDYYKTNRLLQRDVYRFTWRTLHPADGFSPGGRMYSNLVLDEEKNLLRLFFGVSDGSLADDQAFWVFNLTSMVWSELETGDSEVPIPRYGCSFVERGRQVYFFGGVSTSQMYLADLWSFDMDNETWTLLNDGSSPTNSPQPQMDANMLEYNGVLYIFGGYNADEEVAFEDLWMYGCDCGPGHDWWRTIMADPPMKYGSAFKHVKARHQDNYIMIGAEVDTYEMSGHLGRIVGNYIYMLELDSLDWVGPVRYPQARFSHSLAYYGGSAWLFGGFGAGDVAFNDLWKLSWDGPIHNVSTLNWLEVADLDLRPQARGFAASAMFGSKLVVHGGATDVETIKPLDDMWMIDLSEAAAVAFMWQQFVYVADSAPRARSSHKIEIVYLDVTFVALFGGKSSAGSLLNDLWLFDPSTAVWTEISPPSSALLAAPAVEGFSMFSRIYAPHSDRLSVTTDGLFVMGGLTSSNPLLTEVWHYDFSTYEWEILDGFNFESNVTSEPIPFFADVASAAAGNEVFFFGGSDFDLALGRCSPFLLMTTSFVSDDDENVFVETRLLGRSAIARRLSGAIVTDTMDLIIFGGSAENAVAHYVFNDLLVADLSPICSEMDSESLLVSRSNPGRARARGRGRRAAAQGVDCFQCVPGTTYLEGTCVACDPGTVQPFLGSHSCYDCPGGFFGGAAAARTLLDCQPCPFGTMSRSNNSAAAGCVACEPWQHCPLASEFPLSSDLAHFSVSVQQPPSYESNGKEASDAFFVFLYTDISLTLLLLSVVTAYFFEPVFLGRELPLRERVLWVVQCLDIFKSRHIYRPRISSASLTPVTVVVHRRTVFGGATFLFCIGVVLGLAAGLFIPYRIDNVVETTALLPMTDRSADYTSRFFLNVTLHGHTGDCEEDGHECSSSIDTIAEGLSSRGKYQCYNMTRGCSVLWTCSACMQEKSSAFVKMDFLDSYASAAAVEFKMEVSSGLPEQESIVSGILVPANEALLFRGSEPTKVLLLSLRTEYVNLINYTEGFGYHLNYDDWSPGSMVGEENFTLATSVKIQFDLDLQGSQFYIERYGKYTLLEVLTLFLGAAVGMMALGAVGMIALEHSWKFIQRKWGPKKWFPRRGLRTVTAPHVVSTPLSNTTRSSTPLSSTSRGNFSGGSSSCTVSSSVREIASGYEPPEYPDEYASSPRPPNTISQCRQPSKPSSPRAVQGSARR